MLRAGFYIEDYEIVRQAASGATSVVYEARHRSSGRTVALKVLDAEWCLYEEVIKRFLNEARALGNLRHDRLIMLFAQGRLSDERPYMVLEWLPYSLDYAIERTAGKLPIHVAARAGSQIGEALHALHTHGIVHRDLKPANLLMADEDLTRAELKLVDLGLAKLPRETSAHAGAEAALAAVHVSTGGSEQLGTWEYMAPEQWIRSKGVDAKTDVYSLGVLLFQMLTGRLPFVAQQRKEWMGSHLLESPPLDLLTPWAPPAFRELIARMLSKKAGPRPTMCEVTEQLKALTTV